jgi:capsular polysaccharide biosynthesis protein
MSSSALDIGAEREVDLKRWREAFVARWWVAAAGLLAGAAVGAILSLAGGSVYQASVLVSPGQAFSPGGAPVLNYLSSPLGIGDIVNHPSVLAAAAAKAHVGVGQLRGNVSIISIATGVGTAAARGSVLIRITVQLQRAKPAELAAGALGQSVLTETTSSYVRDSAKVLQAAIAGYDAQLKSLSTQIQILNKEVAVPSLDALTRIILVSQANNAIERQATISNNLATSQHQLSLAQSIENAQLIGPPAKAVKTTARSRRNSVLIGGLIGLIIGAITAVVADSRLRRL